MIISSVSTLKLNGAHLEVTSFSKLLLIVLEPLVLAAGDFTDQPWNTGSYILWLACSPTFNFIPSLVPSFFP